MSIIRSESFFCIVKTQQFADTTLWNWFQVECSTKCGCMRQGLQYTGCPGWMLSQDNLNSTSNPCWGSKPKLWPSSTQKGKSEETHPVHSVFDLNSSLVIVYLHCTFSGWQHFPNQTLPVTCHRWCGVTCLSVQGLGFCLPQNKDNNNKRATGTLNVLQFLWNSS